MVLGRKSSNKLIWRRTKNMFKLKEVDPLDEKRKEKLGKLIEEGERFKKKSLERWNNKTGKFNKK